MSVGFGLAHHESSIAQQSGPSNLHLEGHWFHSSWEDSVVFLSKISIWERFFLYFIFFKSPFHLSYMFISQLIVDIIEPAALAGLVSHWSLHWLYDFAHHESAIAQCQSIQPAPGNGSQNYNLRLSTFLSVIFRLESASSLISFHSNQHSTYHISFLSLWLRLLSLQFWQDMCHIATYTGGMTSPTTSPPQFSGRASNRHKKDHRFDSRWEDSKSISE